MEELRSKGLDPYAYKWERTHTANQLQVIYKSLGNGEELSGDSDHVSIAGRIVARRAFGKLAFLTLRDDSGTIQVYCLLFNICDTLCYSLFLFALWCMCHIILICMIASAMY